VNNKTGVLENKAYLLYEKRRLSLIILNFEKMLPHCHTLLEKPLYKVFVVLWQQQKVWQQNGILDQNVSK